MSNTTLFEERIHTTSRNGSGEQRRLQVATSDYCQVLLSRLFSMGFGIGGERRTIGFTSCVQGEGVTTVAGSMAVHAADCTCARVLAVDANLSSPGLHNGLGIDPSRGLLDVFRGTVKVEDTVQDTPNPNLSIIPAGSAKNSNHVNFDAGKMQEVVDFAAQNFDMAIVDLPSISAPTNLPTVTSLLDGVVLVLAAEGISGDLASRYVKQLSEQGTKPIGVTLNRYREYLPRIVGHVSGQ